MPNIKAHSKEIEKIFDRLIKDGLAYTNNMNLTRSIGRKYKNLLDDGWLDIGHIDRRKQSVIIKPPDVVIFPKDTGKGLRFYFERLRL